MSRGRTAPAEPRRAPREVEVSLVVVADDPESVLRRIARLREIGRYVLHARGSERIVDRYFDTPGGALRERGWALRLRALDGTLLIGLKGPRRGRSTKTEDRFERERPFAHEAVEEIGARTGLKGADRDAADANDPVAVLEARLGVRVIQERETSRLVRDAAHAREVSGPALAELALDQVRFQIEGREIRHYEIEVESKRPGPGTKAAKEISAELVSRYGDELLDWSFGKLPTGRAIEDLLARGALDDLGPEGRLRPGAYEQIRRHLENEGR